MANRGDRKGQLGGLTDVSRNKRQASVLLNEIARERTEAATRKCAQSEKLLKDCKNTFERAKRLCNRRAS